MNNELKIDNLFSEMYIEASKGSCLYRKYSAAIVKGTKVVSIGYAQNIDGSKCNSCKRFEKIKKHGNISEFFEDCSVIHAEAGAILNCNKKSDLIGGDLYLLGVNSTDGSIYSDAFPCNNCLKIIQYVGIKHICVFQSNKEIISYEVTNDIKY